VQSLPVLIPILIVALYVGVVIARIVKKKAELREGERRY
jgi:hypothetical protein